MGKTAFLLMLIVAGSICAGCFLSTEDKEGTASANVMSSNEKAAEKMESFTRNTTVGEVMNTTAFNGMGRLLFPLNRPIESSVMLEDVGEHLLWYEGIKPERTVAVMNYLHEQAAEGKQFFMTYIPNRKKRPTRRKKTHV